MCYHKSTPRKHGLETYLKDYQAKVLDYDHYYHVSGFSHPQVPVMTMAEPHLVQPYMWGLVPLWAKDRKDAQGWATKLLNATCEKAFSTYKPYVKTSRCLVFVDGIFEWQWKDGKGKEKIPYYIFMEGHQPFTLGGIYNEWEDREMGNVYKTYSVMTTPANDLMTEIHNNKKRMPLIVNEKEWGIWLDPASNEDQLKQVMIPYPEGFLKCHQISRDITKRGYNTNVPEIQGEFKDTLF